jgi:hypothetical protein
MIAFRRIPALHGGSAFVSLRLSSVALLLCATAAAQGTEMKTPDDTKPLQITGCLTARTKNGGYILSRVFARPVTVVGSNYLQMGMGHQVTLTGTWQAQGIAPNSDAEKQSRMFVATQVKVTAKQCATPPSAPESTVLPAKSSRQ